MILESLGVSGLPPPFDGICGAKWVGVDPLLQPGLLSGRGDDWVCPESVDQIEEAVRKYALAGYSQVVLSGITLFER